ncbi:MAG: GNAT family N-acetyltransferase [Patescibacteria group bacterium]
MENFKDKNLIIEGKIIYLKPLNEGNATKEYCNWLCDKEVNKYLTTKEATVSRLKEYIQEQNQKSDCLFLGIFANDSKKHIGNIKLELINFKTQKATIGILVGDKNYWGRGVATETIKLMVDYGFNNLALEEINLEAFADNKAAIRVYEKAGFKISDWVSSRPPDNEVFMLIKK